MDPRSKVKRKPTPWEKQRCLKRAGAVPRGRAGAVVGKDSYEWILIIVFFRSTLIEEDEVNSDAGGRASKKKGWCGYLPGYQQD
jgi:hypothetical protein